jgi:hypothetical protein
MTATLGTVLRESGMGGDCGLLFDWCNAMSRGYRGRTMRLGMTSIPRLVCLSAALALPRAGAEAPCTLGSGGIRIEAQARAGALHETYLAQVGGQWVAVAESAEGGSSGPTCVSDSGGQVQPGTNPRVSVVAGALVEEFSVGGNKIRRTIRLARDGTWFHVTTRLEPSRTTGLAALVDRYRFLRTPDWSFAPSVGGFASDIQYKAPLVLVQSGPTAFGIVPDLATLDRAMLERCSHTLDLDVPGGPLLAVGFRPAHMVSHSVYAPDETRTWVAEDPVENSYYLLVTASAKAGEAYREVVRMHWETFGRPLQNEAAIQQTGTATPPGAYSWLQRLHPVAGLVEADARLKGIGLWDDWRREVWGSETPRRWLLLPLPDGSQGGGVQTLRWGPGPAIYLTAWFNTLRTSFGMALYARRTGDEALLQRARQTLDVALKAPGKGGAFKCIGVTNGKDLPVIWAAGDGNGDSTQAGFLGYDMAWTGYWMLRWREAGLPGGDDAIPRCRALAEFLCGRQSPDGMLPTRFTEDGSVQEELSRTVKAETGPVALFLLELYSQDRDPRWLASGRRGLGFLEQDVIPLRQWYDFETFWSCSPRKPALDERSRQWPANDLALGQAVAAFLTAYRVTGDRDFLGRGEKILDYLLLYQQCWTNPLIDNVGGPATLLGGFTTQNSDAEWSDARQSQVGNILLDYYRATGKPEYLERAVAALRSQFPVSPCENFTHSGYNSKSGISSFHWGTGSGMAGIEIDEDYLHDAVVDATAGVAIGVDGLDVTLCRVTSAAIELGYSSPFAWHRSPVFVFHRCDPGRLYSVTANGKAAGTWSAEALERGIDLPFPATTRLTGAE